MIPVFIHRIQDAIEIFVYDTQEEKKAPGITFTYQMLQIFMNEF